ncbi:MAG TPA: hypothetical protein PLO71_14250 [Thauera phenylacetica]|nr:hypothetical protein [Thauera phenylacetica]
MTDTDDIVLHARSDSALHRQQFVLHEFAHMILGHCEGEDCVAADALLPGQARVRRNLDAVKRYLERTRPR